MHTFISFLYFQWSFRVQDKTWHGPRRSVRISTGHREPRALLVTATARVMTVQHRPKVVFWGGGQRCSEPVTSGYRSGGGAARPFRVCLLPVVLTWAPYVEPPDADVYFLNIYINCTKKVTHCGDHAVQVACTQCSFFLSLVLLWIKLIGRQWVLCTTLLSFTFHRHPRFATSDTSHTSRTNSGLTRVKLLKNWVKTINVSQMRFSLNHFQLLSYNSPKNIAET